MMHTTFRASRIATLVGGALLAIGLGAAGPQKPAPEVAGQSFDSPDAAVTALVGALRDANEPQLVGIFGPGSQQVIHAFLAPGEAAQRGQFLADYDAAHSLTGDGATRMLVVGASHWPFPVPLRQQDGGWRFDGAAGRQEILARMIGFNEISAQRVCEVIAEAERDYSYAPRDGASVYAYASKLISSPGRQDGLYWPAAAGAPPSPLGPAVEGAEPGATSGGGYYGYHYKILTGQGPAAPGGAYSYMVRGQLVGGFAVLAWPVTYGISGVQSFMLGFNGQLYQQDLGARTAARAAAMRTFNPDAGWHPIELP